MILVFVLTIICDIVFYLIFANIFTQVLFAGGVPTLMPLLIMVITAVCSYLLHKIRPLYRFLPIILLPLCLFWQHNIASAILISLPCVYIMLTIIFKNFSFDPDRLKEKTVLCAKIILLSLLAIPFAYEYLYSLLYFHYVFIYIGCAICVLRISRTDKKILADPKFIFINIATVFGSLAVLVVLGSTQVLTTIWQVVKFICADIIAPAVMFVINWLNRLFPHTDNNIDITGMDISEGLEAEEYALTDTFTEAGQLPDFVVQIIQWVFIILLILFAIFVLRKITGSFRRKNYAAKGFSEIRSSAVPIPEDIYAGDKQSFFAPRNPRLAVRYHYRRFLKICADKGCPPEKGDTSKDVNLKNKTKFPEEAISRLRELYLKARYSEHAIKATESKEAGELVKHL